MIFFFFFGNNLVLIWSICVSYLGNANSCALFKCCRGRKFLSEFSKSLHDSFKMGCHRDFGMLIFSSLCVIVVLVIFISGPSIIDTSLKISIRADASFINFVTANWRSFHVTVFFFVLGFDGRFWSGDNVIDANLWEIIFFLFISFFQYFFVKKIVLPLPNHNFIKIIPWRAAIRYCFSW